MSEVSTPAWSLLRGVRAFAGGAPVLVADVDGRGAVVSAAAVRIDGATLSALAELGGDLAMLTIAPDHAERLGLTALRGATRQRDGIVPAGSVDAVDRLGQAGSPEGRAHTIRVVGDPKCHPAAITSPGHVHTAIASEGAGDAASLSLELARQAGDPPAVVLCPVVDGGGRQLSLWEASGLPRLARVPWVSATELRSRAVARELEIAAVQCWLPTRLGSFRAVALMGSRAGETALALVHGDPQRDPERAIVRTHVACMLGDTFGSMLCDCRAKLEQTTREIVVAGSGVIVYVKPRSDDPLSCPAGRESERSLTRPLLDDTGVPIDRVAV